MLGQADVNRVGECKLVLEAGPPFGAVFNAPLGAELAVHCFDTVAADAIGVVVTFAEKLAGTGTGFDLRTGILQHIDGGRCLVRFDVIGCEVWETVIADEIASFSVAGQKIGDCDVAR